MESSDSPLMTTFKSKKPLITTPNKNNSRPPTHEDPTAVVTPERANPNPSARIRNQNFALSVSDVRRKAHQLLKKPGIVGSDIPKVVPEKLRSELAQKPKGSENSASLLSDKSEMLCKFFNAMISSIRLLRMKKQPPTFSKLARSVESLTDRRFTLHHLAQLKYILPEVIVLKKVRVQDEDTKCMKEGIHVSLEVDAVETDKNSKGGGGFSQLKEIFQTRMVNYYKTHENDDVPEGELPQLFHKPKQEPEPNMNKAPALLATSLTAPSFKRRFSSRLPSASLSDSTPSKPSSLSETPIKEAISSEAAEAPSDLASTPAKIPSIPTKLSSTPAECASTPARLMAITPALRTPKRTLLTSDHDSSDLPNKSAKRRSLKFDDSSVDIDDPLSRVEEVEVEVEEEEEEESSSPAQGSIISKDDVLDILPEGLLQSLKEKEKRILEEKDPIVLQAKTRQKLMAGVPKLFDMIYLLFQSFGRSVITKEELIYKLVSGHLDVIDRNEVEEQLKLLQEVAPEYISEQQSLSGDTLLRLNKLSCADSIRAKLLKAK
ncbi:CDT1-like protein a chloroplastic [Bienertia sinuspersici]